ncbi:MAG: mandelate racemase/muconate lactonizing enzyme family protein [Cyclobacterium sp.]|uniref:mandelate racemase/muconate lactonizing enzyme family protein n=1 Tax=Cyclobacterium sp. TaxID=1966343 RepID=UPI00397059A0
MNKFESPGSANEYIADNEIVKIREIQLRSIKPIIFKTPFYDATMGPFNSYAPVFLKITDDEGNTGECEFPGLCLDILKLIFIPILLDSPKLKYSDLHHRLFWNIRNEGFRGGAAMALGHLDRVFYDLFSKRKGLPLYRYLGSNNPVVKAYASGCGVNIKGTQLKEQCLEFKEEGYDILKMKFGGFDTSVTEDLERIAFVRDTIGDDMGLAADANQCMELGRAMSFCKEAVPLELAWLEEPIHSAALVEMETLCSSTLIPISYGESERTEKVFPSLVKAGVKHLQPIAGHINSVKGWLSIAKLAKKKNLQFSGGGSSYYNAQFLAAAGEGALLEFLKPVVGVLATIALLVPEVKNGHFHLSEEPGNGVVIDWHRLTKENRIVRDNSWKR